MLTRLPPSGFLCIGKSISYEIFVEILIDHFIRWIGVYHINGLEERGAILCGCLFGGLVSSLIPFT